VEQYLYQLFHVKSERDVHTARVHEIRQELKVRVLGHAGEGWRAVQRRPWVKGLGTWLTEGWRLQGFEEREGDMDGEVKARKAEQAQLQKDVNKVRSQHAWHCITKIIFVFMAIGLQRGQYPSRGTV
jgi:hypothetical protein